MKRIQVTAYIIVPEVPKKLEFDGEGGLPLSAFSDDSLNELAEVWKKELFAEARRQREMEEKIDE